MKKRMVFVAIALLLLNMLLGSFAAGEMAGEEMDSTTQLVVMYVPATRDATTLLSARYIVEALAAKWPEKTLRILKTDDKTAEQSSAEEKALNQVIKQGSKTGAEAIANKKLVDSLSEEATDLWVLIPSGEAYQQWASSQELMDQFKTMLTPEASRLHVVVLSDSRTTVTENDPYTTLLGEKGAQIQPEFWILPDFLEEQIELKETTPDTSVHTGNYWLGTLFGPGAPMDLVPEWDQKRNGWRVELPENGEMFFLVRQSSMLEEMKVMDQDGKQRNVADAVRIPVPQKDSSGYYGVRLQGLPSGQYYFILPEEGKEGRAVSAYWYPDLERIQPLFDVNEQLTREEDHVFAVTIPDMIPCQPERVDVKFDVVSNPSSSQVRPISFNGDYHLGDDGTVRWEHHMDLTTNGLESVSITPSLWLYMEDGNLVWFWQGEEKTGTIVDQPIKKAEGAPQLLTLYYDSQTGEAGDKTYHWSDFFEWNEADNPEWSIEVEPEGDLPYEIQKDGFTVRAKSPETDDHEDIGNPCVLSKQGSVR